MGCEATMASEHYLSITTLLTALDELTPTVVAVMVLFAAMNVAIFLKLG